MAIKRENTYLYLYEIKIEKDNDDYHLIGAILGLPWSVIWLIDDSVSQSVDS